MRRFAALSRQADFARLRRHGRRSSTKHLVIYRSDSLPSDSRALVGITVSKSIGKAVTRNKLRRRLTAILDETLAHGIAMRLLVIARPDAALAAFGDLRAELTSALRAA
ncbi:MAG: ribonuclease P protein component [Candidatus Eremiobacteraeota bacterium]|nr:ribonuclease P protein component [Candidatus Eremiobacteraeota bacterium]